jgi:hypothetical protein
MNGNICIFKDLQSNMRITTRIKLTITINNIEFILWLNACEMYCTVCFIIRVYLSI